MLTENHFFPETTKPDKPNPYPLPHIHPHYHPPKPHFTIQEEFLATTRRVNETLDRVLRMEDRIRKTLEEFMSTISADNVEFKNLCTTTYNQFSQAVTNEVNSFESDMTNTFEAFKNDIEAGYSDFSLKYDIFTDSINERITTFEGTINDRMNDYRDSLEARIEEYNTNHEEAFNEYVEATNSKIAEFERAMNEDYTSFTNATNENYETFVANYESWKEATDTEFEARFDSQDATIQDAVHYFKTNFNATVSEILYSMKQSGELTEYIENEVFTDMVEKVNGKSYSLTAFGSLGDGIIDETENLKLALASGKSIYIPEGTYMISEPLYINVDTTSLIGASSKAVLKATEEFPAGEHMITFYSPNGDYYTRKNREREHGGFSVVGNSSCHGVRIGGAVGTDYEGNVEASIFKNIMVDECIQAFTWGAHAYRNTLINCDSHHNSYALITAEDITDAGETMTFINCGFWSGALKLVNCGEAHFYSCTIHTKANQVIDDTLTVGHYFKDSLINFTNCHFEAILRTEEECNEARPIQFYSLNANVNIDNAYAVISGEYMTLSGNLFFVKSNSGRTGAININGGDWKYYLGRIKTEVLSDGNVTFNNVALRYAYDGITIPYKIYNDTTNFDFGGVESNYVDSKYELVASSYYADLESKLTVTFLAKNSVKLTVSEYIPVSSIGIYKKVPVIGKKTLIMNGTVVNPSNNFKMNLANNSKNSMVFFVDEFGRHVASDKYTDHECNETLYQGTAGTSTETLSISKFLQIPPKAKYVYIGVNFDSASSGLATGSYNAQINMNFELI